MSFLFTTFVLTKENYEEWSNKKKEELMSKGLWEIVENGYEWPKDLENMTQMEKKTFASLRWKDHCARIIMNNGVDEVASDHILGEDSSNDAWNLLQKEYGKKTDKIEKLNCIGEKKEKDVEEPSKIEDVKIKPGEMNAEVDVKIDEDKRSIEEKKVVLEGKITEIVEEISVVIIDEFHDDEDKEVSKDYMIYILNKFIFESMIFGKSCKNEFWKTFKNNMNGLAKVYNSEIWKVCKDKINGSIKID